MINFLKMVKMVHVIILMTIKIEDFDHDNILIDEKSYENILVYNILCKNQIAATPLLIRFNKLDGFIRVYDGTSYLILFGKEKHDAIYIKIRYGRYHTYNTYYVRLE